MQDWCGLGRQNIEIMKQVGEFMTAQEDGAMFIIGGDF